MKLLIFCPYYPPHVGGLESHADEFNKHMAAEGYEITVFTPRLPNDAPVHEERFANVSVIRFPAWEIIHNYPLPKLWDMKYWQLWKQIWNEKFDVVISRTRFFNTSLWALCYARLKGVKWVHIEHGSDFVQVSSWFSTLIAKIHDYTFGNLIFAMSDLNISISRAVQSFVNRFNIRQSPVIYRGLDMASIDSIEPNQELLDQYKGKIIICSAGRLYKWKGMTNSIKAVNSLHETIKKRIVFLIAGDGEDYERLKKQADSSTVLLGSMPRHDVISLMKASDIYIHSSYPGGGLSTSLLEAMYCGCAVIATPHEGANEVVRNHENGVLIKNSNSSTIREALTNLLTDDPLRNHLGKEAHTSIKSRFSWQKSTDLYVKLFTNTIQL